MTDWQDNPGHMPVEPDVSVYLWLALFPDSEPTCRQPTAAGKLIWGRHGPGQIAKWRRA